MIHLLDINVLLGLADTNHLYHTAAARFFEERAINEGWATCPITQSGFVRIFGLPAYPNGIGSPTAAFSVLKNLITSPGHQFWTDDIGFTNPVLQRMPVSPKQVTDCYLLALAASKGGRFTTFDRRIDPACVEGGREALLVLDNAD